MKKSPFMALSATLTSLLAQPSIAADSSTTLSLEEVAVTAQRREQSLQDVGLAVTALTGDNLFEAGVTNPQDMSLLIPALEVGGGGGANTTFFVRGVGNFTVNGYSDPATAFNYDDVYIARPTSAQNMFFDVERIELLKGPQGTLYGRNATAGAVNLLPVKPRLGETEVALSASLGNYKKRNLQGALNLPIGDSTAVRLSGQSAEHDAYLSDGTSDEELRALRVQWLTEVNDQFQFRISADYSETRGQGIGANYDGRFILNTQTGDYDYQSADLGQDVGMFDESSQSYRQDLFFGLSGRTADPLENEIYMDNDYQGIQGEFTYTSDLGTWTLIPAYRKSTLDNLFASPAFYGFIQEQDEQTSLEVRLATERLANVDVIVGGHYFDETVDGNYTFSQQALASYQDFETQTESYALFVDSTAHLSEGFRVIGGLRYTVDDKSMAGQADVYFVQCGNFTQYCPSCPNASLLPLTDSPNELVSPAFSLPTVPGSTGATQVGDSAALLVWAPTPNNASTNSEEVTWRVGIEYDLSADALFYGSYATGYRSGGFSLAYGYETFEPEYLNAYTLGIKSALFDRRWQLNVEAFYWDYKDQQISHNGVDGRGNQGLFVENTGESVNQGVEIETAFVLTETLKVHGTVQYLDAEYTSFSYTEPAGATPPLTGCASVLSGAVYQIDCSGMDAYQAPEWVFNLGVEKVIPVGNLELVARVDTQYKDERIIGFEYLDYQTAPSFWRTNASIAMADTQGNWTLTAWVNNLEDDLQPNTAPVNTGLAIGDLVYEAPRTYGMRLDMAF